MRPYMTAMTDALGLLKARALTALILTCVTVATATAELSRWQLGTPSLVISLPGNPSAGGVDWQVKEALTFFPTTWSSEDADLRVEVARQFTSESATDLAKATALKLGLQASDLTAGEISGVSSASFAIQGGRGLAISGQGRAWIVVAKYKSGNGQSLARSVFDSIVVERWGDQRWVQRNLGKTRMNAQLPYELATKASQDSNAQNYELHFDDFEIEASVSRPSENSTINLEGTVKLVIEDGKKRSDPNKFTSEIQKVKHDQLNGYIVNMTIGKDSKVYTASTFMGMDNGSLLRLDLTGRKGEARHATWISKILESLRVSSVGFAEFAPRQIGSEGVWVDLPKPVETASGSSVGVRKFGVFAGAFAVDIRVQDHPGVTQLIDQFMAIEEAALTPRKDVKDLKIDTNRRFVDGVEARLLQLEYRLPGRGDKEIRSALVLFLPDKTVVLEMITNEGQKAYLDRIIDTAHVELRVPSGWSRQALGESGLSFFAGHIEGPKAGPSRFGSAKCLESVVQDSDITIEVQEYRFDSTVPLAGLLVAEYFKGLKTTLNVNGRILEQRPISTAGSDGIRAVFEFEHPKVGKLPIHLLVLKKSNFLVVITAMPIPGAAGGQSKLAAVFNSFR